MHLRASIAVGFVVLVAGGVLAITQLGGGEEEEAGPCTHVEDIEPVRA